MMKPIFRLLLLSIALLFATVPPAAIANRTETTSANCYSADTAYVTGAMNIRQRPSTASQVVAKAQAGDYFNVTASIRSERWCWLNVSRGWLANTTRVQSTKPQYPASTRSTASVKQTTTPQTPSNIDNCCFIDRQCSTDHEWESGYWAFQNNQCGAQVSPLILESSAVSSDSTAIVDNCCQIGWNCNNYHDWQTGFIAFHTNQCQHYGIEIEGPDSFAAQLHATLDLIQERAPNWYAYIIDGLTKIRYDPNAPRSAVYSHSGTWHVPPSDFESWGDMVSIVGSLAHEACHVHLHMAGRVSGGLGGERACLATQIEAARAVFPTGREYYLNWATNLLANIDDPAYQWWH